MKPVFKRILLKLSGEALMGEQNYGIDTKVAEAVAQEIKAVHELGLQVAVVVGGADQIADVGRQSQRLHDELPNSTLIVVPGVGHMIHHLAPARVIEAVELASKQSRAAAA